MGSVNDCWLDYIPYLRKIALFESNADKNYAALNLNNSDDKLQNKRRSTRRSKPQGRLHYFDAISGSTNHSDRNIGKDIGEEMARLHLQYDGYKTSKCTL
jgi:hypothetical protein